MSLFGHDDVSCHDDCLMLFVQWHYFVILYLYSNVTQLSF